MKRTMKTLLALALVVATLFALAVPATAAVSAVPDPGQITGGVSARELDDGSYAVTYTTRTVMIEDLAKAATVYRSHALMRGLRFVCTLTDALSAQMTAVAESDFTFTSAKWDGKDIFVFEAAKTTGKGIELTYKLNPDVLAVWHTGKAADVKAALQQQMTIQTTKTVTAEQMEKAGEGFTVDARLDVKGEGIQKYYGPYSILAAEGQFKMGQAMAECDGGANCPSRKFTDVDLKAWYHQDVDYVLVKGLMAGTGATTFAPHSATTRGMIVTILHRLEGKPAAANTGVFPDVKDGQWYTEAVCWAAANGVVTGYGNGNFGPNDNITREQMAAILYRYAQYKGVDVSVGESTNILSFSDATSVSGYAVPAMQWAVGAGVIGGSGGKLLPQANAQRCQVAAILHRFCVNILGQ